MPGLWCTAHRAHTRGARPDQQRDRTYISGPLTVPDVSAEALIVRATHVEAPPIDGLEFDATHDHDPFVPSDPDQHEGDATEHTDVDCDEDGDEPPTGPLGRPVTAEDLTPQGRYRASVTDDPEFVWRVPGTRLLVRSTADASKPDTAGQEQVATALLEALGHFGIDAKVVGRVTGPHITRYELRLAPGIKVARVASLKDDLAYALAATDIRILAPIPGKTAVGVEVPNARRKIVHLGDVFQDPPADWSPLTVWLGKDISGRAIGADLGEDAAPSRRGDDRSRQVGLCERDAGEHPPPCHAA